VTPDRPDRGPGVAKRQSSGGSNAPLPVGVYDAYLAVRRRFAGGEPPEHVAVTVTERDLLGDEGIGTLESFLRWAFEYDAERVTVAVSVLDEAALPTLGRALGDVDAPRPVAVRGAGDTEPADAPVGIGVGLGGRREFADAVRELSRAVEAGEIEPGEVDQSVVGERLVFPSDPDLLISPGTERLPDSLIWQSAYTELYFADADWESFGRRDYLRAVLAFQRRTRRYGR